jgi:hypothetical protein
MKIDFIIKDIKIVKNYVFNKEIMIFDGAFFVMSFLCFGMHLFFSLWFAITKCVTQ